MAPGQRKEDDREAERGSDRQLKLVPGHCETSPAAGYRFSGDAHCPGNDVARNDLTCLGYQENSPAAPENSAAFCGLALHRPPMPLKCNLLGYPSPLEHIG